ncbi:MAG: hypothetical protein K1060chlam2_00965, partial [Chlamydiae bacterium]|nr:hypothetical protein [Chlamydiota bacterium]
IADIHFSSSKIEADQIRVGNPRGYNKTPRALSIDSFSADVPLTRFFDDNIVIEEMLLDDVYLGLEFDSPRSKKGNWTTIMNNVSRNTTSEKKKAKDKGETTSVLIKKLILTDLKVELAYKTGGQPNRKLRPIRRLELTNISSEGGIPTNQIMHIVMQETLRSIFSREGLQNMLEGVLDPGNRGGSAIDTLKGLFSEVILLDNDWEGLDLEIEEHQEIE